MCVVGARPNYMKIKPLMDALAARDVPATLVHTGQHYDNSMNDVFFEELGIRKPDHSLGVGSGTHAAQTANIMLTFEPVVEQVKPDVVVVVGDVNSTVACSLVAAKSGSLVAHVEAGLRSRDWSMPEEINRVVTDRLSDFLFAPSPDAVENLEREGYRPDQIHLVGNVMVDTLLANLPRARERTTLADLGLQAGGYGLVTLHRPSNVDDPATLSELTAAMTSIAGDLPLVFPVHPRTRARLGDDSLPPAVRLLDPIGYLDFLALQADAALVLTDSGGIQEETTVLGVPCLTARESTERPITVSEGTNRVVGTKAVDIVAAARDVLDNGVAKRRPALWDGRAADRIVEVLAKAGPRAAHPRPTDIG